MTQQHSGSGDINRSLALMWEEPAPSPRRGPKARLTLETIVDQAIAIADVDGLEAVSMRRIATDLAVGTMSLYRHVPGKEELLDLMIERVSAVDQDLDLGPDWRTAMERMSRGLWDLYTKHPWLPLVDQTRPLLGPNALHSLNTTLEALADTRLSSQEKIAVIATIDALVQSAARTVNAAVRAEHESGMTNQEFWQAQEPILVTAMESGRYPHLAALDEDSFEMSGEDEVAFALACFLDGLALLVEG